MQANTAAGYCISYGTLKSDHEYRLERYTTKAINVPFPGL
jgi:hypothetical protein